MGKARLLWVDLCARLSPQPPFTLLSAGYVTKWINHRGAAPHAISQFHPSLICIEFDRPAAADLQLLRVLRDECPEVPLLMLTDGHAEALAVWAFRAGVADYRIKPVPAPTLARVIALLTSVPGVRWQRGAPARHFPDDLLGPAPAVPRNVGERRTGPAVRYIDRHFERNLKRDALAALCHLAPSTFSRVFHEEHGETFERFVLQRRIAHARRLLVDRGATVARAAYASGFHDLSYFARVFKRIHGESPSRYRRRIRR